MSASFLLALLEAHEDQESDLSRDYFAWVGAQWDGGRWVIPKTPEAAAREELIMRELYDVLQSTIQAAISKPEKRTGMLGTVLARALTNDPESVPPEDIRPLRAELKRELHERFKLLIDRHAPLKPLGAQTT
jgi:hypothetical protein